MNEKVYTGTFKLNLLNEELWDAFPAWRGTPTADGYLGGQYRVEAPVGDNPRVRIRWKPATTVAEVDAVVAAHDPTADSTDDAYRKRVQQVKDYVKDKVQNEPSTAVTWLELGEILKVIRGELAD